MQTTTLTTRPRNRAESGFRNSTVEIPFTAYDAAEREYETTCTVEYDEDAGGALMIVGASVALDLNDEARERLLSALRDALGEQQPRFAQTSCSQCGKDLGPGDAGVSSCADHARGA